MTIAGSETYTKPADNLIAGMADIVTGSVKLKQNIGVIGKNTVLGMNDSTGIYEQVNFGATNGTEKAVAILMYDDEITSEKYVPVYIGGQFFRDELVWPSSATDAQKAAAFVGTNISLG